MARQVTVTEAAKRLKVSRRTIERRIKSGALSVTRDGRRRLVALPDDIPVSAATETEADNDATAAQLAQALAQCAELRQDNDILRQRVADLVGERDYLRQALAAALRLQQKALLAPGARPWWQFWRRGEQAAA